MTLSVRLFARAKDLAGVEIVRVTLPPAATVADLRRALMKQHPALGPVSGGLLIAVNAAYAADALPLTPDAEVACFPPVSGG